MITKLIATVKGSTLLRYVFVGGTSYAIELALLLSLVHVFQLGTGLAVSIGFWAGLVISFLLQKFFAFGDKDTKIQRLTIQSFAYALLVIVNYSFTLLFVHILAPIIGLFIARTLALIITTGWNYIVYKKLIFTKEPSRWQKRLNTRLNATMTRLRAVRLMTPLLIITIAIATSLVIMSFLARMVADDYAYFQNIRTAPSYLSYIIDHYTTHNGRLAQASLVTASFALFKDAAVHIMPVILFASLSLALAWCISLTVPFTQQKRQLSLLFGTFIAAVALLAMPSLFDSYLWLTSSTVYLGSLIGLFVTIGLVITLTKLKQYRPLVVLPIFGCIILSQSFSEPTSALSIALAGLWLGIELIRKNIKHIKIALSVLAACIVGLLVVFLSPGTMARRADMHSSFDIPWMVLGSFGHYITLFSYATPWIIGLVVLGAFVLACTIKIAPTKKSYGITLSLAALIFLASTYITFFVNNYGGTQYALRNFSLPVIGVIIAALLLCATVFHIILHRYQNMRVPLLVISLLIGLVSSICALQYATTHIKALALRDAALTERQLSVAEQLQSGAREITVSAAPVLTISDAVDIENPGTTQTDWLVKSVRNWYDIPRELPIVIENTDETYCAEQTTRVKANFVCR